MPRSFQPSRRTRSAAGSSSLAMIARSVAASGGVVEVAHDVDVDAELLGDLHRLTGLRAAGVVVDRRVGHGVPP